MLKTSQCNNFKNKLRQALVVVEVHQVVPGETRETVGHPKLIRVEDNSTPSLLLQLDASCQVVWVHSNFGASTALGRKLELILELTTAVLGAPLERFD